MAKAIEFKRRLVTYNEVVGKYNALVPWQDTTGGRKPEEKSKPVKITRRALRNYQRSGFQIEFGNKAPELLPSSVWVCGCDIDALDNPILEMAGNLRDDSPGVYGVGLADIWEPTYPNTNTYSPGGFDVFKDETGAMNCLFTMNHYSQTQYAGEGVDNVGLLRWKPGQSNPIVIWHQFFGQTYGCYCGEGKVWIDTKHDRILFYYEKSTSTSGSTYYIYSVSYTPLVVGKKHINVSDGFGAATLVQTYHHGKPGEHPFPIYRLDGLFISNDPVKYGSGGTGGEAFMVRREWTSPNTTFWKIYRTNTSLSTLETWFDQGATSTSTWLLDCATDDEGGLWMVSNEWTQNPDPDEYWDLFNKKIHYFSPATFRAKIADISDADHVISLGTDRIFLPSIHFDLGLRKIFIGLHGYTETGYVRTTVKTVDIDTFEVSDFYSTVEMRTTYETFLSVRGYLE